MKTFTRQKRLIRMIAPLTAFAAISVWTATADRGSVNESLGLVTPVQGAAQAVVVDRSIRDYKLPGEIPWAERPNGSANVTLYGDASKPGIYVSLLRRPPDNWSEPHSHPTERYATVLQGTFLAGTGPVQDRNRVGALKAGAVVSEVPMRMHYDGVGADGVTLMFVGMGPSGGGPTTEAPRPPGGPNVDPTARLAKELQDMTWTQGGGNSFVNVFGDPSRPGLYVRFERRTPNSWSTAHRHASDQFIMVMDGSLHIGTGTSVDKDKTVALPKGSFIHDRANGVHYDGTKGESVWLLVAGMGPAAPETSTR